MLTWMPGDAKPEGEWNTILEAHDHAEFYAVMPEGLNVPVLMEALQNIFRRAVETHYGWDEALILAEALKGKN